MKKSTTFIIAAVLIWITGITAANIKLTSTYKREGKLPFYKTLMLKPFSHIVEIRPDSSKSQVPYLIVNIEHSDSSCAQYGFYDNLNDIANMYVRNDTLYIHTYENEKAGLGVISIKSNRIKSLQASGSIFQLNGFDEQHTFIDASNIASISVTNTNFTTLTCIASGKSNIILGPVVTTDSLSVTCEDVSGLSLRSLNATNKKIQMKESNSLTVSGSNLFELLKTQ